MLIFSIRLLCSTEHLPFNINAAELSWHQAIKRRRPLSLHPNYEHHIRVHVHRSFFRLGSRPGLYTQTNSTSHSHRLERDPQINKGTSPHTKSNSTRRCYSQSILCSHLQSHLTLGNPFRLSFVTLHPTRDHPNISTPRKLLKKSL